MVPKHKTLINVRQGLSEPNIFYSSVVPLWKYSEEPPPPPAYGQVGRIIYHFSILHFKYLNLDDLPVSNGNIF